MPTARAMPISERRSAASITKIRKISSTPAAIANSPNTRKNETKIEPICSASSTISALVTRISACPKGCSSPKRLRRSNR